MGVKIVNNASGPLEKLHASLKPERVAKVIAVRIHILVTNHLYTLNTERHKSSASYGFWAEAAKQTQFQTEGSKVLISINQIGVRQRYFGGPIVAGAGGSGKKYLTIPARDESYGRAASEFDNLVVVYGHQRGGSIGPVALATASASEVYPKGKGKIKKGEKRLSSPRGVGGEVMFWLVQKVTQQSDPSVLPTEDQFMGEIKNVVDQVIAKAKQNQEPEGGTNV